MTDNLDFSSPKYSELTGCSSQTRSLSILNGFYLEVT